MKVVVVGLGSMGKRRIRLLRMLYPNSYIIGVDSREDRRAEVNSLFRVQTEKSLEMVFQEKKLDCAFICTAPASHAILIKKCLNAGLHIFTEINLLSEAYDEILQLAHEKKKIVFLSSTPLYREEMRTITKLLKNERPIQYLYHVGQYLPDWHPWEKIENYFVSDERTNGCREILAIELPWMTKAFGKITRIESNIKKISELSISFMDTYVLQVWHEKGSSGIFIVDVVCRHPVRYLEVYNEKIYLTWSGKPDTLKQKNIQTQEMEIVCKLEYLHEVGYGEFINEYAYINEMKEFFEVLEGKPSAYSLNEDRVILDWIDKIEGIKR